MSDQPQEPGWWIASDGRWYPPELHPGAAQPGSEPVRIAMPSEPPTSPNVVAPEEVEAAVAGSAYGDAPPLPDTAAPPTEWPAPPEPESPGLGPVPVSQRVIGGVVLATGLLVVVASFMPWATFGGIVSGDVHGWSRNDGVVTVALGVVAAGIGAAMLVGLRSVLVKVALVAVGLVMVIVAFIDTADIGREQDRFSSRGVDVSVGWGLWVVALSGLALIVLGLVERSPWGIGSNR